MSEINQAVARLKVARDVLSDKIAVLVNNYDGDFADDFSATDWRGEFAEELVDLGERLYRLNHLINNMPVEAEPVNQCNHRRAAQAHDPSWDGIAEHIQRADTEAEFYNRNLGTSFGEASWEGFVAQIDRRNIRGAVDHLGCLLGVNLGTANRCTNFFAQQMFRDRDRAIGLLNSLTAQLRATTSGSLNLLRELFDIHGNTAVMVYQKLCGRR